MVKVEGDLLGGSAFSDDLRSGSIFGDLGIPLEGVGGGADEDT